MDEALDALAARRASTSTRCACARSRSATRSTDFIAAHEHGVRRRAEPRRAAAHAAGQRAASIDPARLMPVLHYDGTPITARFIIEAIAERVRADNVAPIKRQEGGVHDLPRQAEAAPPDAAEQQARLHAARLRRQDLDAVRRLRPRLDLGGASSRPAGSSTSSRTASPSSRASAARRRRPTTSSATRTASTPCTAACRRC